MTFLFLGEKTLEKCCQIINHDISLYNRVMIILLFLTASTNFYELITRRAARGGDLKNFFICCFLAVYTLPSSAFAQDFTFQFNNPSFGGSSFNSSHLLSLADIQNQHTDDGSTASTTGSSQSDLFVRQLQSRLLSSLSSGLSEVITGAEPGDTDTIVIGDQQIFYERSLEDIRVQITNLLDGSSTEILLPVVEGVEVLN